MELNFTKMQAAGNDYIYLDCRAAGLPPNAAALAGAVRAMSAMQFDCAAIAAATRRRFGEEENYKTLMRLYGRSAAEE